MPRINCTRVPFLVMIVLAVSSQFVTAQTGPAGDGGPIRVHILPAVNRTGQAQFDAVATTVTSTVSLTLRLLGSYEISEEEPDGSAGSPPLPTDETARMEVLAELAETLGVENIVFGEVLPGDPVPEITLAVYDRLSAEITLRERRRPQNLFGIFGATDELAAALLTGFSGRRVAFGSIRIEPTVVGDGGAPGSDGTVAPGTVTASRPPDYRVILDGEDLGTNLRTVDSILTGEHRLTVTADILGETETLLDRTITVEEGAAIALPLELPDIDLATETAALERRRAQERLDMALRELEEARAAIEQKTAFTHSWQRSHDEIDLAEEYFLTADEYLDPARVRTAAVVVADTLAAGRMVTGRAYLSRREYDEGVEIVRTVPELGARFNRDDLFGYRDEVGFINYNWSEYEVQRERKPTIWVPIALIAAAMPLSGQYWDPVFLENDGPMKDGAFMVPVLFGAAFTGFWNAVDWDYNGHRAELRRYGETDEPHVRDELTGWPPGWWELAVGARALSLSKYWVDNYGASETYGARSLARLTHAGLSPSLALRRWVSPRNAVGVNVMPGMLPFNSGISITTDISDGQYGDGPSVSNTSLGSIELDWTYTRTGRGYLRGGVGATHLDSRISDLEHDDPDGADAATAETVLYADSGGTTIWMYGVTLETGFRFGRRPYIPWTLGLGYRLEMLTLGEGTAADKAPYFAHTNYVQLTRAWAFGEVPNAHRPEYEPFSDGAEARERTNAAWPGLPVTVRADGGGALAYGPFLGAEYHVTDLWSIGLHGRLGFGVVSNNNTFWHDTGAFVPLYPGLSVRRYFQPQQSGPEPRGFYLGVVGEYIDFAQGGDGAEFYSDEVNEGGTIGYRYQEGNLWVVQLEGGYRLPIWRSAFLEIGGQLGRSFGDGFYSASEEIAPDGSVILVDDYDYGPGFWFNPVIALGTRLY